MIKEVTYWCKECELPLADEKMTILLPPEEGNQRIPMEVKTGVLVCLDCKKRIEGNREYI
jgi:hypothetical protein